MNTNNVNKTIKVDSRLTTDILVQYDGQTWMSNLHNEYAQFIAMARLIDQEEKTMACLRFESEQFVIGGIHNIHDMWIDFHKRVVEYCDKNVKQFVGSHIKTPVIKII